MMRDDSSDAPRLPEDVARRLLDRAVELDAARDGEVTLPQLREVAQEAGVSLAAFETALAEMRQASIHTPAQSIAPVGGLSARIRSWLGLNVPLTASASLHESVVRNLIAVATYFGILTILVVMGRVANVDWLVRKAIDPVAMLLGAAAAARFRARPASILFAGLAISQGAEFFMDAEMGAPSVHGFGSHLALMIAGVAGVLLGGWLLRRPPTGAAVSEGVMESSANTPSEMAPPSQQRRAFLVRLRHV